MRAVDLIRWAMALTEQQTERLVADLRAAPMTRSTPGGKGGDGNHAIWTLGHLCVVEGSIPEILLGEPNPVGHWKPLFFIGSQPSDDASLYPTFDELLGTYRRLRAANAALLERLGEAGLDRQPAAVPPGFEDLMKTFGQTILLVALHNMLHLGQVADMRRVVGLKPLV
jgi:uncharacterized damage-inducible protein DinB